MDPFDYHLEKREINTKSILSLAYLGDSVYELMVRSMLCAEKDISNHDLHSSALRYVSAEAQAALFAAVRDTLSEDELIVFNRGRNSHPKTVSKSADRATYHTATGFEALIGYLYLAGRKDRLSEIFGAMALNAESLQE